MKRWRKRLVQLPRKMPALSLPHSSVFVVGIGIGLAAGLVFGVSLAWLDGKHAAKHGGGVTAAVAPAPEPAAPAPAAVSPSAPIPPVYVEQTETVPDDASGSEQPSAAALPQGASLPTSPSFQPLPQAAAPEQPAAPLPAEQPAWLKNAVASIDPGNQPMIAIVLDDVGAAPGDVAGAVALPAPITLSIMTYAPNAQRVAEAARKAGHEIMVHVPMEAVNRDADPGRNALLTSLTRDEIRQRLDWDLSQFQGYVGINNHMGSRFTQDADGMQVVLEELKARGLLFLDSRTIASSVGDTLAGQLGIAHLKRDVFLDNVIDEADIRHELARAEGIAKKQGFVIAIGHPHRDTVAALRDWIPEAKARGFVLVPISVIAKKQAGVTG